MVFQLIHMAAVVGAGGRGLFILRSHWASAAAEGWPEPAGLLLVIIEYNSNKSCISTGLKERAGSVPHPHRHFLPSLSFISPLNFFRKCLPRHFVALNFFFLNLYCARPLLPICFPYECRGRTVQRAPPRLCPLSAWSVSPSTDGIKLEIENQLWRLFFFCLTIVYRFSHQYQEVHSKAQILFVISGVWEYDTWPHVAFVGWFV